MKYLGYILFIVCLSLCSMAHAQKAERDYIRKGNRLYNDSAFVDSEIYYRKALDINPNSTASMYNLGNTLFQQNKMKESLEQYVAASNVEKDKPKLAQIYHNMGVIFQTEKDYAKAVEAYKNSLRNNPSDNETRYNLALAQKMLKEQQQNQNQQQDKQDKNEQKKKNEQKENTPQQNNENKNNENKQQPPAQEDPKDQMSKENAEQLLKSVMQDEKEVQDKLKKQMKNSQERSLEKDW